MIATGVILAPVALLHGVPLLYCLSGLAGLVVGKYVDPDMRDQESVRNESEHEFDRMFGKSAGRIWSVYWQVPSRAINHRSRFSHLPILGTFVAASWLLIPISLAIWLVTQPSASYLDWSGSFVWNPTIGFWFAGWVVQDAIHLFLDSLHGLPLTIAKRVL